MRIANFTLSVITAALLCGCQGLGFGDGSGGAGPMGNDTTGDGDGVGGVSKGVEPGVGGGGGAPQITVAGAPMGVGANGCPGNAAELDLAARPTVIDAPKTLSGYASAQYARHVLLLGSPRRLPEPALLRPDDFLAYYGDRSSVPTGVLSDGGSSDVHLVIPDANDPSAGYLELRLRRPAPATPAGSHFVILADVSPSMADARALEEHILAQIGYALTGDGDVVSVVTFAGGAETELTRGTAADLSTLLEHEDLLDERGGNDLEGALKAAMQVAQSVPNDGAPDLPVELILLTDGGVEIDAPVSTILSAARSQGVRSSAVQVAKVGRSTESAVLHDAFLQDFAAFGGGARLFIGGAADADLAFGARFAETFRTAFSGTTLAVTLPGGFTSQEELSQTGNTLGASGGYDRWHSTRHHVSICEATKTALVVGNNLIVEIIVLNDGSTFGQSMYFRQFNAAFATPSVGARLEDAILATVQYLRAGAPGDHSAADFAIEEAKARADCVNPVPAETAQACASLDELEDLLAATQGL